MNDKHRHGFCLTIGDSSIRSTETEVSPAVTLEPCDEGEGDVSLRLCIPMTLAKTLKGEFDDGEEGVNELW